MVVGEKVSLEEMGGARMHCTVSGVGDLLAHDDAEAIELARLYFSYLPGSWRLPLPTYHPEEPAEPLTRASVPERESQPFDVHDFIDGLVDDGSFFEVKPLFAAELVVGFARMDGETVGIVANNSAVKGGVLFSDSADKALAVHLAVRRLLGAAGLPRRRAGLHDRLRGRARRHHPARRQDGVGRGVGHRAAVLRGRAQGLRRRALRDGRAGLRARRHHRAAHRPDRRHGARGGRERGVRQQDRRGRGGRGRRRRATRSSRRGGPSTRPTSTSSGSPPTSSSTRSSRPTRCAPSCCTGCATPPGATGTSPTSAATSLRSDPAGQAPAISRRAARCPV